MQVLDIVVGTKYLFCVLYPNDDVFRDEGIHISILDSDMSFWLLLLLVVSLLAPSSTFVIRPLPSVSRASKILKMSSDAEFTLTPSETALVLIEFQNDFTTEGGKLYGAVKEVMEATNMLENSRKLMDYAREAGVTIIHCPILFEKVGTNISRTRAVFVA